MSGNSGVTPLESLLMRDRLWIAGGLVAIAALSWAWLVPAALDMQGNMSGLAAWMMAPTDGVRYLLLLFAMWVVMMTGMMLPSAAPTLLLYGRVVRSNAAAGPVLPRVYAFGAGYLLAWSAFSIAATLLQWLLRETALLTTMMRTASTALAGSLLIVGGVYEWTPIKRSCLAHCRSAAAFISQQWRPGIAGALQMGFRHGLYCLGCCWALMLLLFVGGVMSLPWIAALTVIVLLEKAAPLGPRIAQACGVFLIGAGLLTLFRG